MNITCRFKWHGIFNDEIFKQFKMLDLDFSVRCLQDGRASLYKEQHCLFLN